MDVKSEVSEFLRTRRAKVTPEQVALPRAGQRRVAGLRRGEVAALAGISVEYYAKLERGQIAGASEAVLDAIADALLLDAAERVHLKDLARAAGSRTNISSNASSTSATHTVRPALRQIIDSVADAVVFVRDDAQKIVAINDLGRQFYSMLYANPVRAGELPNLARFQFLDPGSRVFYPHWETMARMCVASMRMTATQTQDTEAFQKLVGELSTQSSEFRRLWAAHDVRIHGQGVKSFNHPEVGYMDLAYEELAITADPGLTLYIYSAETGSAAHDKLRLLGTLAAQVSASAQELDGKARTHEAGSSSL